MLTNILNRRKPSVEERALSYSQLALSGNYEAWSGAFTGFKQAASYAPWYNAVSLISGDLGKLPIRVFRRTGENAQELDENHAANIVNGEPIPGRMGRVKWWRRYCAQLLTWSNAYARIIRNNARQPIKLQILESAFVTHHVDDDGEDYYSYVNHDRVLEPILAADMLHVEDLTYHQSGEVSAFVKPIQLIELAQASICLGLAIERFGSKFFERGGRVGGVLEIPANFSKKGRDKLEEGFRKMYEDIDAAFMSVILRDNAKFHQGQVDPDKTQMIQSRAEQVKDIARWFSLPPHKLGDDSRIAYNSLEQENRSYLDSCLSPRIASIEDECNLKLFQERERAMGQWFVRTDVKQLLQTDTATQFSLGVSGTGAGLITVNEWRHSMDMNPVEGGDEIKQPNPEPEPPPQGESEGEPEDSEQPAETNARDVAAIVLRENITLALESLQRRCKKQLKHYGGDASKFMEWYKGEMTAAYRPSWDKLMSAPLSAYQAATGADPADELFHATTAEMYSCLANNTSLDAPRRADDIVGRLFDV